MKTNKVINGDQNSKRRVRSLSKLPPLLGIAALSLVSHSALAASSLFNYTSGDIILDLSLSGYNDLEADLGHSSSFLSQAPGTTVVLAGQASGGAFTSSQLQTDFGALGAGSTALDGVAFTAFGTTGSSADFLTEARSNPSVQNTPTPIGGGSVVSSVSSDILGIVGSSSTTGIVYWSKNNNPPTGSEVNTATVVEIPTSGPANVDSFTTKSANLIGDAGSGIQNTTANGFTAGSTAIVSDLFEYTSGSATYVGDFTFEPNGEVEFSTPSAVPEPSTYGLLGGFGLLVLAFRRQFRAHFNA
jgi:hypothetical protein